MPMMIQKFHRLIQSRIFWIGFLVLVAFSMVFFGAILPTNSYDPMEAVIPEGRLNGEDISYPDFRHHFNQAYLKVTFRTLQPPNRTPEVDEQLRQMAWRRLVSLQEAEKLGLSAGDDEVRAAIQADRLFADQNNQFSPATYNAFVQQFLPRLGINARIFEEHIREEVILQKLQFMLYQASLVAPLDIARRFQMIRDSFTVEYGVLTKADIEAGVSVTEEEARTFFEENQELYRVPDKVKVRFVQFDADDYLEEIDEIPEEDLQAFYDQNIDRYTYEKTEEDIETADAAPSEVDETAEEADTEQTVDTAASDSEQGEADASEEDTDEGLTFPDLADFELPGSDFELTDSSTVPFEEARPEIEQILEKDAALKKAAGAAAEFVVSMATTRRSPGIPFAAAVEKFDLKVQELAPFTEDEVIHGLDAGQAFARAAFALSSNEGENFSDAIRGEEAVYVLELSEKLPSHIPAFSDVLGKVMEDARLDKVATTLIEKAEEIAQAARDNLDGGKPFADVLKDFGITTTTTEPFDSIEGLEDNPVADAIRVGTVQNNAGEIADPIPVEDGLIIARVASRESADPSTYGAIQPQITSTMRRRNFQIMFEGYMDQLLKDANFQDREDIEAEVEKAKEANAAKTEDADNPS